MPESVLTANSNNLVCQRMRILGFLETSLLDWDGRITSVIFVGGCNFVCPFCHNHEIANDAPTMESVEWPAIQVALLGKDKWLDGVVITGGEPMIHPEVSRLCADIKQLGKPVKLDTNGSFPFRLKRLIDRHLVDFVAMDIKAPLSDERYSTAAGRPVDVAPLLRTIRLLRETGIEHEFRITLVRDLIRPDDIPMIGESLRGARTVVLQRYEPARARIRGFSATYSRAEAEAMAEALRPFVSTVTLRGNWV